MNPRLTSLLFVAWQDAESRTIIPVGRLLRREEDYEFAYIGAVRRAQARGFQPLLTFPSLQTVYRSTQLPPLFSNRLMSASRQDFADHVRRLALRVEEAEPFTVLARSAGRRETDKLEVFSPPQLIGESLEGLFLARGLRHIPGAEDAAEQLAEHAALRVLADIHNVVNPNALALQCTLGQLVGYVPDYLAQELFNNNVPSSLLRVRVVRVNPRPAPVHHRLLCHFELDQSVARSLFAGPDYEPLSDTATPYSARAA